MGNHSHYQTGWRCDVTAYRALFILRVPGIMWMPRIGNILNYFYVYFGSVFGTIIFSKIDSMILDDAISSPRSDAINAIWRSPMSLMCHCCVFNKLFVTGV